MALTIANLHKSFAGRISLFHPNWRVLSEDKCVLQYVTEGYHIPLLSAHLARDLATHPSILIRESSLAAIHSLLEKQAIQSVLNQSQIRKRIFTPTYSWYQKGGQRPVINPKRLNNHVKPEHFKMESLLTVKSLIQKGERMAKIDLKDAFFIVPVACQFQHLLLFKVNAESFQFQCLPFGLCMAREHSRRS